MEQKHILKRWLYNKGKTIETYIMRSPEIKEIKAIVVSNDKDVPEGIKDLPEFLREDIPDMYQVIFFGDGEYLTFYTDQPITDLKEDMKVIIRYRETTERIKNFKPPIFDEKLLIATRAGEPELISVGYNDKVIYQR